VEAVKKDHPEAVESAISRATNRTDRRAEQQKEKNPRHESKQAEMDYMRGGGGIR